MGWLISVIKSNKYDRRSSQSLFLTSRLFCNISLSRLNKSLESLSQRPPSFVSQIFLFLLLEECITDQALLCLPSNFFFRRSQTIFPSFRIKEGPSLSQKSQRGLNRSALCHKSQKGHMCYMQSLFIKGPKLFNLRSVYYKSLSNLYLIMKKSIRVQIKRI